MNADAVKLGCVVLFALVLLTAAPASWVFRSYMEAKAYNRVTGANVSTWDAMWIELRVQGDGNAK